MLTTSLKISQLPLASGKQKRIVVITQGADPVVVAEDGKGLAYVNFSDNKHLEAAINKNKQKLLGKIVSIGRSDPSKGKKRREAGQASQDNLPQSGGDDAVEQTMKYPKVMQKPQAERLD